MHEVRYFLAACETLNFRKAAAQCHVTQPALTRAIQKLEAELGGASSAGSVVTFSSPISGVSYDRTWTTSCVAPAMSSRSPDAFSSSRQLP
ncbi:LysR family transcriptional regulator [Mesorhizobium sp. KR9-304]|uniref:LysR family transcriptional regulator n=1 Tax=Mesorhizobium sp. KR9-304 TaxID=3156614 RepID=UPI0032B42FE8